TGTYNTSGRGSNGCTNFNSHGTISMRLVEQSSTTFTGSNVSATGLEWRLDSSCTLDSVDSAAGGTVSGTVSGTTVTMTLSLPYVQHSGSTSTPTVRGTLANNTITGTL